MWDRVDWERFAYLIKINRYYRPSVINEKKLDKMVERFYKVINYSLDKAAPKILPNKKNKDFVWYTVEHRDMSKRVNRLYIRYIKSRKGRIMIHIRKNRKDTAKNAGKIGIRRGINSLVESNQRRKYLNLIKC